MTGYILELAGVLSGVLSAGITVSKILGSFFARKVASQSGDNSQPTETNSYIELLSRLVSSSQYDSTTVDDIDELLSFAKVNRIRDFLLLERLAIEGKDLAAKMELEDAAHSQDRTDINNLRREYRTVSKRIAVGITKSQRPKALTYLQKFLPQELHQHKKEILEFYEDGLEEGRHLGKSGKGFTLKETLHLALFIGKARIFKLSRIRRRTIK